MRLIIYISLLKISRALSFCLPIRRLHVLLKQTSQSLSLDNKNRMEVSHFDYCFELPGAFPLSVYW
jgi:hypothetical protein